MGIHLSITSTVLPLFTNHYVVSKICCFLNSVYLILTDQNSNIIVLNYIVGGSIVGGSIVGGSIVGGSIVGGQLSGGQLSPTRNFVVLGLAPSGTYDISRARARVRYIVPPARLCGYSYIIYIPRQLSISL